MAGQGERRRVTAAAPVDLIAAGDVARCASCGSVLAGPYCHACGQPGPAARQRLSEALLGQTGRLGYTLRMLLTRPGELARATDECRDRSVIRPLTLLLNVVAFFFLLSGLTGFRLQAFEREDSSGKLAAAVQRYAQASGMARELYVERVERRFQSAYTLLLTASVALYALLLSLTHRHPRRSWLVHAAAAVHYVCFVFLIAVVFYAAFRQFGIASMSMSALLLQLGIGFAYLVLMFRRTYDDSLARALATSLFVSGIGIVIDAGAFIVALNAALLTA